LAFIIQEVIKKPYRDFFPFLQGTRMAKWISAVEEIVVVADESKLFVEAVPQLRARQSGH
jgi:hypothetical protein